MAQHHRLREAQRPAHQSVVRGKRRGAVHLLQVAEKTAGFPGVGTGTAAACVCRVRASSTGVFHFRLRPDRPPHTGRRHRTAGKHAGRSNQRSHSRGPPCWVTSARWSTSIWRADTRICAAGSMVWRRSCSSFLWTRFQTACFCSAEGGATGSKRCCGKVTALCCCTSAWRTGSSGARRTTWSRCGGNARRASATRGCARGRNSGAGAQGERQDGPEQIVHVGVPDRAGQIVADHPVRVPAGAQRRVSEAIFRGIPWILAHGRIRRVQSDAGDYAVRLL